MSVFKLSKCHRLLDWLIDLYFTENMGMSYSRESYLLAEEVDKLLHCFIVRSKLWWIVECMTKHQLVLTLNELTEVCMSFNMLFSFYFIIALQWDRLTNNTEMKTGFCMLHAAVKILLASDPLSYSGSFVIQRVRPR